MAVTTVSSREFNQDTGRAKLAAQHGPVFITDRGTPAHVLLTFEDYERLLGHRRNIVELLGLTSVSDDIEIELPHPRDPGQAADLD